MKGNMAEYVFLEGFDGLSLGVQRWTYSLRPPGKNVVRFKWVFCIMVKTTSSPVVKQVF
jgi:hypothetical protein